jgi:aryl-alcohol dehydrogenase-like predicted oxidoreductase
MDYLQLGSTGTRVSELCFGTWRFGKETNGVVETDRADAHALLDEAWEYGINFIDSANGYGTPSGTSERIIGEWLNDHDRDDFVVTSKVYFPFDGYGEPGPNDSGLGRKHIRTQIEGTLDRLDTDYLDVYYIHRWDETTPIEETLRTLTELVREGKVHYLGASTMAAWKLTKALWTSDVEDLARFDVVQPLHHAGYYEDVREYLDVAADQDLAVCNYSPLAGGFLTGKYERADSDDPEAVVAPDGSRANFDDHFGDWYASKRGWKVLDAVREVADELDATPAQVSLRWLIEWDEFTCIPIVGARTTEQLAENVAGTDLSLSDDQWDRIMDARYREDDQLWGH